eukprot:4165910-Alexandrium_andersonii.AAC.1
MGACPHAPCGRIDAAAWRRLFRAAAKRGTGLDGWGSAVLALLPEEALERLSDLVARVEDGGGWPRALTHWRV